MIEVGTSVAWPANQAAYKITMTGEVVCRVPPGRKPPMQYWSHLGHLAHMTRREESWIVRCTHRAFDGKIYWPPVAILAQIEPEKSDAE